MNMIELVIETLKLLGGKKESEDSIAFIKPNLIIKHKDAGVKYTVKRVNFHHKTKKPYVICYRYYGPNSKKKAYIKIDEKDFNKFKPV